MTALSSLTNRTILFLAVLFLVPCMGAVWLMLKPQAASGSTVAIFAAFLVAAAAVVVNTWRNAQATTNTSHVIHATEVAPSGKR